MATDERLGLEPMSDGLFPPSPGERLDMLGAFIRAERNHRVGMLTRHQDRSDYWHDRISEADQALHHLEELRKELRSR